MQEVQAQYEQIIQVHRGLIVKIAKLYTRTRGDFEDLHQDILYQVWKSIHTYRGEAKITTWLYRVALNTAIRYLAKKEASQKYVSLDHAEDVVADIGMLSDQDEQWLKLQHWLDELSALEKAMIILYLEKKSYREIGEITGHSETNVGSKINRIKSKLKHKANE